MSKAPAIPALPAHTKYAQVMDWFRSEIEAGRLKAHEKIPSTRKLADLHGVSVITTRRSLVELEKQGLLYTRRGLGTFVAESALARRRKHATRATKRIGLCGYSPSSPTSQSDYAWLYRTLTEQAHRRGWSLGPAQTSGAGSSGGAFDDFDGLILFAVLDERFVRAAAQRRPAVLLDTWIADPPIDCVVVDNFPLAYAAVRHFLSLGHRRIGYVGSGRQDPVTGRRVIDPDSHERRAGVTLALEEAGCPADPEWLVPSFSLEPSERDAGIERLFARHPRPTAMLCDSNVMAQRLQARWAQAGLKLPEALSVASFSMNPNCLKQDYPVNCFYVDPEEMSNRALDLLLQRIDGPAVRSAPGARHAVGGRLIGHGSTGHPAEDA